MRNSKYAESSGKMDAILHVCKFTRSQNFQLYFHPGAEMCDFLQKIKSVTCFSTEKSYVATFCTEESKCQPNFYRKS